MNLRIIDNLTNIIEHDNVALEGKLICDCGNAQFEIHHSGKQTRGILAPYLVKKDKQILILAKCTHCGKIITIYDSGLDGHGGKDTNKVTQPFIMKNGTNQFEIRLMYNYYEQNFKTNLFEDCFVEINNSSFVKPRILYEGW